MQILSDRLIQLENFLDSDTHQKLIEYVGDREADFTPTTTSTKAPNYRESLVLHSFPEYFDLMVGKVKDLVPTICDRLLTPRFEPKQIECQITSHNDGHYYKVHNDSGSAEVANRVLTYVYYFYREPKAFSGGQLRMYSKPGSFEDIEPINNSIVFFLSGRSRLLTVLAFLGFFGFNPKQCS